MPTLSFPLHYTMKRLVCLFLSTLILTACTPQAETPPADEDLEATAPPEDALDRALAAHGGLDTWRSYGALEYDLQQGDRSEHQLIDLHTRHGLITTDAYTLGFDGTQVWMTPDLDAYSGNPRFYNGLNFYFFAIPFVLADPGTQREDLGQKTVGDTTYDVVRISFDAGTGDSPDDYYVGYFDPETRQLRLLLYTVTFNSQEPTENYNALMYDEWQEVGGLLVPRKMTSYQWDEEQEALGEMRREKIFSNVVFETQRPDSSRFAMPEGAEIAE